jgi:hypothetical protein
MDVPKNKGDSAEFLMSVLVVFICVMVVVTSQALDWLGVLQLSYMNFVLVI